jgi:hypothetical protein
MAFPELLIPPLLYKKRGVIQYFTQITKGYGIPKLLPSLHFKAILIDFEYTNFVRTVPKLSHKIFI